MMLVGHTLPVAAQAFAFMYVVDVELDQISSSSGGRGGWDLVLHCAGVRMDDDLAAAPAREN